MNKPVLGILCFALGLAVGSHHDRLVKETSIYDTAASSGAENRHSVSILGRREVGGSGHRRRTLQDLDPEAKPAPRDVSGFLARHGRSSHALMAAGLAGEELELLREAVRRSPDDPHLQLLALAEDLFPDERLEWARRFKASQPGNALASYLLADQLIKEGRRNEGLAELENAMDQPDYDDFRRHYILAREEVWTFSGVSLTEAALRSTVDVALFRPLGQRFGTLAETLIEESRTESQDAPELLALAASIGRRLTEVGENGVPIDRLIGLRIEEQVLSRVDDTSGIPVPYAGLSRDEALASLSADRQDLLKLFAVEDRLQAVPLEDPVMHHYFDRAKLFGFSNAVRWLETQNLMEDAGPSTN